MKLSEYRRAINKRGSQNIKFVKVRTSRVCKYCESMINSGDSALTLNPRKGKRMWICEGCVEAKLWLAEAQGLYNSVPFDDEGGAMAMQEVVDDAESSWYGRCKRGM